MKESGLSRLSKNLIIKQVEKELEMSNAFFLTQHTAVPAASMDKLRANLRSVNTKYMAVKNSLGKKALGNEKYSNLSEFMTGACGFVFLSEDVVGSSKVLMDFAKGNEGFKVRSGFMGGALINGEQVKALANLPSREVLITRVVCGVKAPISSFVKVLSGTIRKVVNVLDAIAKKKV